MMLDPPYFSPERLEGLLCDVFGLLLQWHCVKTILALLNTY